MHICRKFSVVKGIGRFMGRKSDAKPRLLGAALHLCWSSSYSAATIDDFCTLADVRKGSFYHFFRSKSDLVNAALDHWLSELRPGLDHLFSASQPGLSRLENYIQWIVTAQLTKYEKEGRILGCPLFTLGSEVSTLDALVCEKVQEILKIFHRYLESAIRDGVAQGQLQVAEPALAARDLFSLVEGTLAQARITNDPAMVRELPATFSRWLANFQTQAHSPSASAMVLN